MEITVMDYLNEIGRKQKALNNAETDVEKKKAIKDAEMTIRLSKNFFIGVDEVIRSENLMAGDGSLNKIRLNKVIGD